MDKVEIFLNQMKTNRIQLVSYIQTCRNRYGDNFLQAVNYIYYQVDHKFSMEQPGCYD